MSPELEERLKERIAAGVPYDEIETEALASGYSKESIAIAYAAAKKNEAIGKSLSSGTALFKVGLGFAQSRLDWVVLLGATSTVLSLTLLYGEAVERPQYVVGMLLAGFIALLLYAFGLIAVYHAAAHDTAGRVSIKTGFRWSVQHILPLWWVFLLVFLLIWGGFILLIIPGILLSFLLYFSQFAYLHEGDRGLDALLRSRALVVGRLGAVAKRLLVIFFYIISISFLVSLPYAVFFGFVGNEILWLAVVSELFIQFVTAILTLTSIAAGNQLFLELRRDCPRTTPATAVLLRYRLLGVFGALTAIVALAVVIILSFFAWLGYGFIDEIPGAEQTEAVRSEVVFTEAIAEDFFEERGSYTGVCEVIMPAVISTESVECHDDETSWALVAQTEDEYWCTDHTGYGKSIPSSLQGRTSCLNLPANGVDTEVMNVPEAETASGTPETGEILPMM